ncbi:sulfatase [Candidatus Roizmanbacteria bacterium]|nr:sulfatase [Candidatus Roizmanbacteria bacterium]
MPKKTVNQPSLPINLPDLTMINKEDNSKPLSEIPGLKKENKKVILVTVDTLRAESLMTYGYTRNTSENIDRFAKENNVTVFKNAFTPVPETVPAHVSLLTGLYPNKTGYRTNVNRNPNQNKTPLVTISKIFNDNGYSTAGFYSSTVFTLADNLDLGFQTYDPPITYTWSDRVEISAKETNEKVFNWLDDHSSEDFFLWVHYYEPHNPYEPFCTKDLYSKGLVPSNKDYIDGAIKISDRSLWKNITDSDNKYLLAKYDEEIYCFDKEFGRFIEKLKSLDIYEDVTLVVFGDHGENFDHQSLFHGTNLYQSAVHIPLIVKSPLIKINGNENNVSLVDIFPTFLSYFRLKNNINLSNLDGIDLARLSLNKNRVLYMESRLPAEFSKQITTSDSLTYGVIFNDLKLLRSPKSQELYRVSSDRKEENNLFEQVKSSKQILQLTNLLKKYVTSFND